MKMFDDAWHLAKRLWSVRFAAIGVIWAAAGAYWLTAPAEMKPDIPEWFKMIIAVFGILLAAMPGLAALVRQPKLEAELIDRRLNK